MSTQEIGTGLLTAKQVAAWLNCSTKTVYRMVRAGTIPTLRLGARGTEYRFDPDELTRWFYAEEKSNES